MRLIVPIERVRAKLKRVYRNRIFFERTGQHANLVGNMTLINTNLKLGKNVTIYPGVMFWGDGLIEVGNNVDIGIGTVIYSSSSGGVHIGSNTTIAGQCYIIDMDHGMKAGELVKNQPNSTAPVYIGEDVWLGANVTVLKGSIIGDGAVIGAKSLVKGEIAGNAIAVGVPAKSRWNRK